MRNGEILKLTNSISKDIMYLDMNRIVFFNTADSGDSTYLNLGHGLFMFVIETPDQIMKQISGKK